jgi:hypothetical protein
MRKWKQGTKTLVDDINRQKNEIAALTGKHQAPREAKTMKLRMLRSRHGGVDGGLKVMFFEAGKVYDIEEPLAIAFLREGHAEQDKMVVAPPEQKVDKPEPEAPAVQEEAKPEPPPTRHYHKRGRK